MEDLWVSSPLISSNSRLLPYYLMLRDNISLLWWSIKKSMIKIISQSLTKVSSDPIFDGVKVDMHCYHNIDKNNSSLLCHQTNIFWVRYSEAVRSCTKNIRFLVVNCEQAILEIWNSYQVTSGQMQQKNVKLHEIKSIMIISQTSLFIILIWNYTKGFRCIIDMHWTRR